ncbi:MAG: Hsp20/alpha crystallin family protein [Verrucomicrobiaceae bacterium]|nr:Hsp20/alpha crystallin family protein [Verrucomicrobiaceae bacterium]
MTTCCTPTENQAASRAAETPAAKPRYFVDGTKEAYEVRVEVPGVAKEDVSINLEENVLTIHARRKSAAPTGSKPLHRELSDLDFVLRLRLNTEVDEEKMTASLEHGVLALRLPVKETALPRRIEIQ